MTLAQLPQAFEIAREWTWADYEPHLQALLDSDLNADNIDDWIAGWSALYSTASEVSSRLSVIFDLDTTNEEAEQNVRDYMEQIYPKVQQAQFELNKKLAESGLEPESLGVGFRNIRAQIDLFREENLPLDVQLDELNRHFRRIYGAQVAEWNGEEKTLVQLKEFFKDTDRNTREKAWRLAADTTLKDREALNDLWVQFMDLRKQIAENAGFDNYLQYIWQDYGRFDYTEGDAEEFFDSIEQVVVPAVERLRNKRAEALGLDTLLPWDGQLEVHDSWSDTQGHPPLKAYKTEDELTSKAEAIFKQVDSELGQQFQQMREGELLNLENRKGKAPGGYCTVFPVNKTPFIFMNGTGSAGTVTTLLHEAGHAFHSFYSMDYPYIMSYHGIPIEFAEVASMAMELLAAPYLTADKGGYFSEADAARYRLDHLQKILYGWPYIAVVASFQHWVYNNHDLATDPAECDKKWTELWLRFNKGVDQSGFEDWVATGWHRKAHIFSVPLYYIEYGLAQLGAVQVWAKALENQSDALEAYRGGLKLGATAKLPDLFEAAGAKLSFDAATLQSAVDLIEKTIAELEALES